jgi:protein-L-isoaspartate(D-aspartate) O-methyltransferase
MSTITLLCIALAGVIMLLLLVIKAKVQPFVALLLVSLLVALAAGIPAGEVGKVMIAGMGGVLGSVTIIIGLGAMLARMTELLELTPQSRVLEIGTGSGYQTAILAHLVQHVCSVERIKGLQWQARRRLKNLDLHNVSTRHGDGWQGWQARAPFDAIIVTAAPPEIPTALMTQLDEGGILVLPVGEEHQYLKRVRRRGGEFIIDTVEAVRFVPLVKGELA